MISIQALLDKIKHRGYYVQIAVASESIFKMKAVIKSMKR
jgi:uncharacterized protein YcgL (UPF0745 family)